MSNAMGRDDWNETMRDELGEEIWFAASIESIDLMWTAYCKDHSIEACAAYLRAEHIAYLESKATAA